MSRLYDSQQLFAGHAVIALQFGQTASTAGDHLFLLTLNLRQDSPNPETIGIVVKDERIPIWKRHDGRRREGILQPIHHLLTAQLLWPLSVTLPVCFPITSVIPLIEQSVPVFDDADGDCACIHEKSSEMYVLLMTKFDCPEMTQYGQQDSKIQLLTSCFPSGDIFLWSSWCFPWFCLKHLVVKPVAFFASDCTDITALVDWA